MKIIKLVFLFCAVCANSWYLIAHDLVSVGFVFLAVVLCLCASAIHVTAHEMGHLIGGLVSGYKLVFFTVGTVTLSVDRNGKIDVRIGKSRKGQCVMEPGKPESRHYLCYNLGGVFVNVLLVAAAVVMLWTGTHWMNLLMLNFVCVGAEKIIVNSIPCKSRSVPNDAYVVKMLFRNQATLRDYCMYLKLYAAWYRGEFIDIQHYQYSRPLDVPENELLYYREIQSILEENKAAVE